MMTLCAMAAVTSRIRLLMSKGRSQDVALDEELPGLQQAGVTHLRVQLSMFVERFDEIEPFLERLMLRPWTLD